MRPICGSRTWIADVDRRHEVEGARADSHVVGRGAQVMPLISIVFSPARKEFFEFLMESYFFEGNILM